MFTALFGIAQGVFPIGRFDGHPFALGFGEGMFVDTGEREAIIPIVQGGGDGAYQPIFQDTHTPNTALIEVDPVLHQRLDLDGEWDLLEEREQDALEVTAVLLILKLVARKMDVQAAPGSLATQVTEGQEVIGPEQDMQN